MRHIMVLDEYDDFFLRQNIRVVTLNGKEIEFFANQKDAGSFIQHTYGIPLSAANMEKLGLKIETIKDRPPLPGDAFVTNKYYACDKENDVLQDTIGVIESCSGSLACCFHPAAFREGPHVSCSGGPLPWIPRSSLKLIGLRRTRFWRWGTGSPGASCGGDYWITVPLWRWNGTEGIEEFTWGKDTD